MVGAGSATTPTTAAVMLSSLIAYACLKQCRSPLGFLIHRWRGGQRALRAFTVGIQHGVFCVGCCWGLMLLMFGVGGIHLGWMLVLGVIMFLEKAVTWGRWITMPVGGSWPFGDWRSSEFQASRYPSNGSAAACFVAVADFPGPRQRNRRCRHESRENSCIRWAGSGDL
jgi:Predicted metal-binding integral membrane protein (DUF2182)